MTPSPEAFEIKPLEWRWDEARHEYEAETAVGSYTANLRGDGFWSVRFYPCKGQCVSVAKVEHDDDDQFAFKPKRVAEEHHRKRLLEALTPSEALHICRKERDEAREEVARLVKQQVALLEAPGKDSVELVEVRSLLSQSKGEVERLKIAVDLKQQPSENGPEDFVLVMRSAVMDRLQKLRELEAAMLHYPPAPDDQSLEYSDPPTRWKCNQCGRPIPEGVNGCYNPYTGDDDCDGSPINESGLTPWEAALLPSTPTPDTEAK